MLGKALDGVGDVLVVVELRSLGNDELIVLNAVDEVTGSADDVEGTDLADTEVVAGDSGTEAVEVGATDGDVVGVADIDDASPW